MGILDKGALLSFLIVGALIWFAEKRLTLLSTLRKSLVKDPFQKIHALVILSAVLGAICCAFIRPYFGTSQISLEAFGSDIIVLLDVSRSMLAEDVRPSRLDAAKRKILDLLELSAKKGGTNRIGIVLFAGGAYLYCPPTGDYNVVKSYIRSIDTSLIAEQGTALNEAINVGLSSLASMKSSHGSILILSDGEDPDFITAESSAQLERTHTIVSAIGFGLSRGAPIPLPQGRFLKDHDGTTVITKLNEDTLSAIAKSTGGEYHASTIDDSDLTSTINAFDYHNDLKGEKTFQQHREIGSFFLLLSGILLFSALFLPYRQALFPLILLLSFTSIAYADPYNAAKAYSKNDFSTAVQGFEESLKTHPNDPKILQAYGSALFKNGNFPESTKMFSKLSQMKLNKTRSFDAFYDLGNSLLQEKKYQDAISAYDQALSTKHDARAQANKDIAKSLLEEQQKQQDKKDQEQKNEDDHKDQDKDKQNQSENQHSKNQENPDKQNADSKNQPEENNKPSSEEQKPGENQKDPKKDPSPTSQKDPSAIKTPDSNNPQNERTTSQPSADQKPKSLDEQEAQQWLNSLPDAPVPPRRKTDRSNTYPHQEW